MVVNLSPLAGAGWQFFDDNGVPLAGGLLYTYAAGTTTPLATYTSVSGVTANSNPIVLDAAGRTPSEVWLANGYSYKFVLQDSTAVQIWSNDYIPGVSSNLPIINDASSVAYEQGYTVTAGSFVVGNTYLITSVGTTNFTSIGASSNTVGVHFVATGVGSGTGTAQLSRTVQARLQDFVSVKDFGAKGDGAIVGGAVTGTNDTAAINAAIAACGSDKTLYFPDGMYIITPDGLNELTCSVYGPAATAIASTWSTGGGGNIFKLNYVGEQYPTTLGGGVTGIKGWNTFEFNEIIGSPDNSYQNNGIYCKNLDQSNVNVQVIRGCNIGMFMDGNNNATHQGTNIINITHLYKCDVGLLMQCGDGGNFLEANRITGTYWYGFTTCALSTAGGGNAGVFENIIDVVSMSPGTANASCILFGANSKRNIVRVRSWDSGVSGTGKYIYTPTGTENNLFQVPSFPLSQVIWNGKDILDSQTTLTDGNGRSNIIGSTYPASGEWRTGDICWNNLPTNIGPIGWQCVADGSPGTWIPMSNTLGTWTPTVSSTTGTITSYVVNTASYIQSGKMITLYISVSISDNGTGAGQLAITLPPGLDASPNLGTVVGRDIAVSGKTICGVVSGTTVGLVTYDNLYPAATGAIISISGSYPLSS